MNLRQILTTHPEAAEFLNIKMVDDKYPDCFLNKDLHLAGRTFNQNSPM